MHAPAQRGLVGGHRGVEPPRSCMLLQRVRYVLTRLRVIASESGRRRPGKAIRVESP